MLLYLASRDPAHAAKLRDRIEADPARFAAHAVPFFARYVAHLDRQGRSLAYGLDCYLALLEHMADERIAFLRTGRYRHHSFAAVEQEIYLNPASFDYHMHGLVFAQFFWPEQFARFEFFSRHVGAALPAGGRYLEIGGGHALYLLEAIRQGADRTRFTLVDLSPISMELARGMTLGHPVEFFRKNIFDYRPAERFDFIALGEVIEHVEDPPALLAQLRNLLAPGGTAFVSAPANAPTIDHIHLFHSAEEIRATLIAAGFHIAHEEVRFAEQASSEVARRLKLPVMYAAFVTARAP